MTTTRKCPTREPWLIVPMLRAASQVSGLLQSRNRSFGIEHLETVRTPVFALLQSRNPKGLLAQRAWNL